MTRALLAVRGLRAVPLLAQIAGPVLRAIDAPRSLVGYLADWHRYAGTPGAESLRLRDAYPQLRDRTRTTPFDSHYLHQDAWAAQRIAELGPVHHVDIGSRLDLVAMLTALCDVTFVDIRPIRADVERLRSVEGSVVALPFADASLPSVSCLHVAEHIGLGRYGDQLDPRGTSRAVQELQRVVAPGGSLFFSLPMGRPRVCFNAHRIHRPGDVRAWFDELELVEFSTVDDRGRFRRHQPIDVLDDAHYGCGLMLLRRPA